MREDNFIHAIPYKEQRLMMRWFAVTCGLMSAVCIIGCVYTGIAFLEVYHASSALQKTRQQLVQLQERKSAGDIIAQELALLRAHHHDLTALHAARDSFYTLLTSIDSLQSEASCENVQWDIAHMDLNVRLNNIDDLDAISQCFMPVMSSMRLVSLVPLESGHVRAHYSSSGV